MAVTLSQSQAEIERRTEAADDGRSYTIFLCDNDSGFTAENTVAEWETKKLSGNGYADVTGTLAANSGSWNATTGQFEYPVVNAAYTASGGTLSYNTVVIKFDSDLFVWGIGVESPAITIADGQTKTYPVTFGGKFIV